MTLPGRPQATWTISKAIGVTAQVAWRGLAWEDTALHNAKEFAKHFGPDCPLDQVNTEGLDQWCVHLEDQGKSDGTINRYLACASKLYTVAQERGGVQGKPKFPRRKETKGRIRFLSKDEEVALLGLLESWGKDLERDLCIVLVDTGMRLGEALRIEERDVDPVRGVIHIWLTKNDEPRSVPMTKRVREILTAPKSTGVKLLPITRFSFRATWDRARAHLGFARDKQFVPHCLRHTCASRLTQKGVGLRVVQEWMGHRSIQVTMKYSHLAPQNLLDAAKVLEEEQ